MPRSATTAMRTELGKQVTTLAMLFKITTEKTSPPTVLGFTTYNEPITYGGVTYEAFGAYIPSSIDNNSTMSVDNTEIQGILASSVLASDMLTENDLIGGLWDGAVTEIRIVNWNDLTMGDIKVFKGWLGEVKVLSSGQYFFDLRGMQELLGKQFGDFPGSLLRPLSSPQQCPFQLGDLRCRKDLTTFTHTGTVTGSANRNTIVDTGMAQTNGYFDYGILTFTSGDNEGRQLPIKLWSSSTTTFTLWLPAPYDIQVGDTYTAVAGCDKEFSTCKTKFSNVVNFGGFPTIPGRNETLSYGPPGPNA